MDKQISNTDIETSIISGDKNNRKIEETINNDVSTVRTRGIDDENKEILTDKNGGELDLISKSLGSKRNAAIKAALSNTDDRTSKKRTKSTLSGDNATTNSTAIDNGSHNSTLRKHNIPDEYTGRSENYRKTMSVYDKYHRSGILKNPSAKNTTYWVYKSNFKIFLDWFDENYPEKYLLDKDDRELYLEFPGIVEDFMSHLMSLGNNSKTINNKLVAMSSFFIWCVKRGYLNTHPFQNRIDRMKTGDYDKRRESYFLTDDQLKIIEEHMKTSNKFSQRDKLIWKLLLDTAARRNAILNLKVEQVDYRNGLLVNVKEKGNKIVDLIVMSDTLEMLSKWIEDNDLGPKDYIFFRANDKSNHLTPSALSYTVRKVGAIVGIKDFYPHSVRKTRINQIYNEFGIDTASAYANHKDTKTTKDHYIKAKTSADLRKIVMHKN